MAAVKRTAQNTKTLVKNKAKLEEKMHELASQIVDLNTQIEAWEKPILDKWGYTSAQLIEMEGQIPENCAAYDEPTCSEYAEAADAQMN